MKTHSYFQKIGVSLIAGLVFIFPIFFLPITSDYYEFNKNFLLIISSLILTGLMVGSFLLEKSVKIIRNPFGLPLFGIALSWILSTFLKTPNKWDAFIEPGQTVTYIALTLIFISITFFLRNKKDLELVFYSLLGGSGILAFLTLLWGSNLLSRFIPITFLQSPTWTPTGSAIGTLIYLLTIAIVLIFATLKNRLFLNQNFTHLLTLVFTLLASSLLAYRLFNVDPNNRPIFLSQSASWSIALESLKQSPFWGTGPSTYVSSFTRFRPATYNLTNFWTVRFNSSSNYFLQILTTLGLFGLVTFTMLIIKSLQLSIKSFNLSSDTNISQIAFALSGSSLIYLLSTLIAPPGLVNLFLLFVMLALSVSAFKVLGSHLVHEASIDIVAASNDGNKAPLLPWVASLVFVGILFPTLYFGSKIYLAEYYFGESLRSAAKKQAQTTYTYLVSALSTNPSRDTYHIAYSQAAMTLANSIAGKQNPTDDEKNTVTQLIQESIIEAKNAVSLNPNKVANIENLAGIYYNLLGVAQGADAWTIAAYRQAILLDPVNPNLRIALGGVLFASKNYDEAIKNFQQAADLKPNLANAYYNLSAAYREKGDFQNSYTAMQVVTNLVDKNSADYTKAINELEELRKKLPQATVPTQVEPQKTELEAPKPLPQTKTTPIKLPANLGPETTSIAPTPSPAPSKTP